MNLYWMKKSKSRFLEIDKYITSEFGKTSSIRFKNRIFKFLELLSKFPKMGSLEVPEKNIYGFQVTKQTRVFYRIRKSKIVLLTFFDSRQDPNSKPT